MEVLQYQVINAGNGYCVAIYDETVRRFLRLSVEVYAEFEAACKALVNGSWTMA